MMKQFNFEFVYKTLAPLQQQKKYNTCSINNDKNNVAIVFNRNGWSTVLFVTHNKTVAAYQQLIS